MRARCPMAWRGCGVVEEGACCPVSEIEFARARANSLILERANALLPRHWTIAAWAALTLSSKAGLFSGSHFASSHSLLSQEINCTACGLTLKLGVGKSTENGSPSESFDACMLHELAAGMREEGKPEGTKMSLMLTCYPPTQWADRPSLDRTLPPRAHSFRASIDHFLHVRGCTRQAVRRAGILGTTGDTPFSLRMKQLGRRSLSNASINGLMWARPRCADPFSSSSLKMSSAEIGVWTADGITPHQKPRRGLPFSLSRIFSV